MLRREPVIDGGHDGRDFPGESAAHGVVGLGIGAQVGEAAAVEEHNHRKLLTSARNLRRLEEAKPEVS